MPEPAIAPDVAIADTWTPSRRMQAAAAAERERVERELGRLGAREDELAAELAAVQASRAELERQRHVLNHFTHGHDVPASPDKVGHRLRALPQAGPTTAHGMTMLRGARIRETAVRILADNAQPDAPVHYRDWFELVIAQGFMPTGKDPLATFLTQIGRSPVVQRTTTSGVYVLDLEFPRRALERLAQLAAAQSETQELSPNVTVEEIAVARERREQLVNEMEETQRHLEEAVRSLAAGTMTTEDPHEPRLMPDSSALRAHGVND